MDDNTWIKLFRKITSWEWYTDSHTFHLFLHLLLNANHREKKWKGQTIKAGERLTSQGHLAQETGLTVRQVRTSLNRLKMTGEVTVKITNKFSLIKINNWQQYQQDDRQTVTQTTSKRQANDKQTTTNNNVNNVNNERSNILSSDDDEGYDFQKKIKTMFEDKDRRMAIIAYYWTTKGFNYENKKKYQTALKRELRPAGELTGYSNEEIKKTCQWLKDNADFKWTLETVSKYIDEPLETMSGKGGKTTDDDYLNKLKKKYGQK